MIKSRQNENIQVVGNKSEAGFAILFSILLASFLITLGISIFSISLKEIQIVTSARDSQIAYYVADSAKECALFWDVKFASFPSCNDSKYVNGITCSNYLNINGEEQEAKSTISTNITCNGIPSELVFSKNGLTYETSIVVQDFFKASSTISSPVADISISKTYSASTSRVVTTIEAYGHNTGILGRRVERGIQQINN